jgi:hypothetical protein
MPHPTCTVCTHEAHEMIDSLLMSGGSVRGVARRFGLSPAAVHRHQHHGDREKNRINTGDLERINAEIKKLHHAQTAARKRRDNDAALAISRELRSWHVLKQKAELSAIGTATENATEQLSPTEAVALAMAVIEARLGDPDVRSWVIGITERIPQGD